MRFSSAFNRAPAAVRRPPTPVARTEVGRIRETPAPAPKPAPSPARELPLDLDQQVRLVGEW